MLVKEYEIAGVKVTIPLEKDVFLSIWEKDNDLDVDEDPLFNQLWNMECIIEEPDYDPMFGPFITVTISGKYDFEESINEVIKTIERYVKC